MINGGIEMDYIINNKAAWEEAFEHRRPNWGEDNYKILMNEKLPFLNAHVVSEIEKIDLKGKTIAQFCCNNGRELLSLMHLNPSYGVGFDIAENIIEQAKETARKANIANCEFVAINITDIDESYYNKFDFIFFTIGAITWFKDLNLLFEKVLKCLRTNGILLINDFHPFMNMLPLPHEDGFDGENLKKIIYSYFKKEPWIENSGMGYMTPQYESKTFTTYIFFILECEYVFIFLLINCV
jgi:ubiquinone/menaquinone biosynthesis C-methylase UbiE